MNRTSLLGIALAAASIPATIASAAELPAIKTSAQNPVPECATPGRMMAYLKARNKSLDPRFEKIAVDYMREGEAMGLRWDYAFAQMAIETNYLTYRAAGGRKADVSPTQNNFAGIGATGRGAPGESFKDVATGVKAHLQHLLLYAGEQLDNPVADRTRKVQEWGVLKSFHAKIKGPVTFQHLSQKWAVSSAYGDAIRTHAGIFYSDFCTKDDPQPELLAEVRGTKATQIASADIRREPRISGAEIAQRAIEDGKALGDDRRRGLGAAKLGKPIEIEPEAAAKPEEPKRRAPAMTILNAPRAEPEAAEKPEKADTVALKVERPAARPEKVDKAERAEKTAMRLEKPAASIAPAAPVAPEAPGEMRKLPIVSASAGGLAAKSLAPTAGGKCRVWTASYGGQRAVIIRSHSDGGTNYTVLDVNEGAEKREAEAYISAYAKGGVIAAEFTSQTQALDKAFEICPEG